jgi:hypothetical protein
MSDRDSLERLQKKLDSGTQDSGIERTQFFASGSSIPQVWQKALPAQVRARVSKMKPLELFFFGSVAFFVLALLIATFLFLAGNNTVSTKNVNIQITGPSEIGAGSTLSLQIAVTNRNAVPMQLTDLVVEFPSGTRSATDSSQDLPRIRESLGTINPGQTINRTVRAVLFGLQGTDAPIKVSAEYRVPSSNAVFVSEAVYTVRLNESPASISVNALTEAVSGQQVSFTASVHSNSPDLLSHMLLSAAYPPGFTFISSSPAPLSGQNVWNLGDIEPGGERAVTITGIFTGEEGESRVMHLTAGSPKTASDVTVAAPLAMSDLSLTVTKPFVSVSLALDGDSSSVHPIVRGQDVTGTVNWVNNLPVRVQNLSIILSLNGQILDRFRVRATGGFYNSNTSQITWDRSTDSKFADIAPGASGTEDFTIAALPTSSGAVKNPEINLQVSVTADRLSESNVPESLQTSANMKALVATDVGFVGNLSLVSGSAVPKVGAQTVYLITWQANNPGSAVANASVSATLPAYVAYIAGGNGVTYNSTSHTVTWDAGDIAEGGSVSRSFQIGFTPSVSQINIQPPLVTNQTFVADDRFARTSVTKNAPDLTTSSIPGGGEVTQ